MVPVLESLLESRPGSAAPLSDTALIRLAELAPDRAARIALGEVRQPAGRFGGHALAFALDRAPAMTGEEIDARAGRQRLAAVRAIQGLTDSQCGIPSRSVRRGPWAAYVALLALVERHGSATILQDVSRRTQPF
jgi:hypothetical protein